MTIPRKKIAYISGTRADFGLMTPVLLAIEKSKKLSLQVYATGMHLMPEFGSTIQEVRKLFRRTKIIDARFDTDDRRGMAEFIGVFLPKAVAAFKKDRPDLVLLLGDRPEMLTTALACLYLGIPTGHLHGGERTATVDEVARHAITKLVSLHFPATKESAERLKKMGEEAWRIHAVGAPTLDTITQGRILSRHAVAKFLKIEENESFILVVQHPVSEEWRDAGRQMRETLHATKSFGMPVVVLYPHADAGGRRMITEIEKERGNPLFRIFSSVSYKMFLALERDAAVWVGNSSAMCIESASFQTPCVNVGERQSGRMRGKNVLDVGYRRDEIRAAIEKSLHDKSYLARVRRVKNLWGDGKTAKRVVRMLEHLPSREKLTAKQIAY